MIHSFVLILNPIVEKVKHQSQDLLRRPLYDAMDKLLHTHKLQQQQ